MPRWYDVRTAALVTHASVKWIDNLLSRYRLPGVEQGRQGISRRISEDGLLCIELTRLLNRRLRVPLVQATRIVIGMFADAADGSTCIAIADGVELMIEFDRVRHGLHNRIVLAMESSTHVRRGRPLRNSSP